MGHASNAKIQRWMKPCRVLAALVAAFTLTLRVGDSSAQKGVARSSDTANPASDAGGALEVPPRLPPSVPPAAPSSDNAAPPPDASAPQATQDSSQAGATDGAPAPQTDSAAAAVQLPYLGLSVQYIVANDVPGKEVHGLEVVGVDPNSPAEIAGIHGRGKMTKLGASGATAGELMAPLNLIVMPLLKKAGELGDDGDLIIAIDDNRVGSENDLKIALQNAKPGDVLYLTVVRPHLDRQHETLKLPVKLGLPRT